jgi:flagellar biosynthesis protein FlhA
VLDPTLEQLLLEKAQAGSLSPSTLGMDPKRAEQMIEATDQVAKRMIGQGRPPVLLTSPVLRPTLFNFFMPIVADLAVLSYNDLIPEAQVDIVDQLRLP